MNALFGSGRKKEPEPRQEPELTPEERLLAEKARAAAAKRESERREQTLEVSDFLDGILGTAQPEPEAGAAPGPAGAPGPDVDLVLSSGSGEQEAGRPEAGSAGTPSVSEAPEAPEHPRSADVPEIPVASSRPADSAAAAVPAPLAFEGSEPVSKRQTEPAVPMDQARSQSGPRRYDARSLTSLMNRRTLSVPLAETWAAVMSLGRSGEGARHPEFEPEAAGTFDRMTAGLGSRRRRRPRLAFEPEGPSPGPLPQSAELTKLLHASARTNREKSSSDTDLGGPTPAPPLPGDPTIRMRAAEVAPPVRQSSAAEGDDEPTTVEPQAAAAAGAPAPIEASTPVQPRSYSLDDLPSWSGSAGHERAEPGERSGDVEPAMAEEGLDDADLRDALAAAEAASRRRAPAGQAQAPVQGRQEVDAPSASAPGKKTSERRYSMDDLPAALPASGSDDASDFSDGGPRSDRIEDDRLGEEGLPQLPAVLPAEPPAPPPAPQLGSGSLKALERATDTSASGERSGPHASPVEAAPASAATPASDSAPAPARIAPPAPSPVSPYSAAPQHPPVPVAAENAADLSINQLADMERYIEDQMDTVTVSTIQDGQEPRKKPRSLANILAACVTVLWKVFARALRWADGLLNPYSLSCKRLVGIAGLIMWAIIIAMILKIWILPGMHSGE